MSNCPECENCFTCQIVGSNNQANCAQCQKCVTCQIVGSGEAPQSTSVIKPKSDVEQKRFIRELTLWNTGKCQLACKYCFAYTIYNKEIPKDMSDDVINKLPEFIANYMVPNGSIWFFGAEPLAGFSSLEKIYDVVHSAYPQFSFGLTTNGVALKDENVAKWLGERKFGILISVDGWGKDHDVNRVYKDGSGSFDDVMEGICNARLWINNNPQLRWTFTPETVGNLYVNFCRFIKAGLTTLACEPVYEVEWTPEALNELSENLEKIGSMIIYLNRHNLNTLSFKPFDDAYKMVYGNERGLSWQSRCGLVNNGGGVGVDVDGTIYACHRFVTERKDTDAIGSIQNGIDWSKVDAIRAEWNSVKPHAVNPERCNTCPIRATCIGGCIAVNKDTTKDLHTLPKSDCDLKLAILKGLYKAVLLKRSIEMETANARQMNACNAKK